MKKTPPPKRRQTGITRIAEVRRKDLIDAAITSIADIGYGEVTVQTICETAGVSRGLIGHYFAGKDELLLEAVRQVATELGNSTREAARNAGPDPVAKLHAVIAASFSSPVFSVENVAVWTALAGNARWTPHLATVYRDLWGNYRTRLAQLIKRASVNSSRPLDAQRIALTFTQLMEGMWVGWLADPHAVTREAAEAACHDYLDAVLGGRPEASHGIERKPRQ